MNSDHAGRGAFSEWADRWLALAAFDGEHLTEADYRKRADGLLALWRSDVPEPWERSRDEQLLGARYRRNHKRGLPSAGTEHELERQILTPDPSDVPTLCFGRILLDGVNAVPLSFDAAGGRAGNVEADMLLLIGNELDAELLLVEVKTRSNHPWYAVVESLRQLRLGLESDALKRLMGDRRRSAAAADSELSLAGVVLAPADYWVTPGRNIAGVLPAARLAATFRDAIGIDIRLASWDPASRVIETLSVDLSSLPIY